MVSELEFNVEMPPSANALYNLRKGGKGKALSPAAKAYRKHIKEVVKESMHLVTQFPVGFEEKYGFAITLYLLPEHLENPGWFEFKTRGPNKGQRKAQTRYKKIDIDNRVKFLQDCIVKTVGIPGDEQVFVGRQRKCPATGGYEHVYVRIYVLDEEALLFEDEDF